MASRARPFLDRFRPILYAFIAGLVIGLFGGWFFHGLVGTLIRVIVVILLLIPFVAAFLFWRSVRSRREPPVRATDIEADWRERP